MPERLASLPTRDQSEGQVCCGRLVTFTTPSPCLPCDADGVIRFGHIAIQTGPTWEAIRRRLGEDDETNPPPGARVAPHPREGNRMSLDTTFRTLCARYFPRWRAAPQWTIREGPRARWRVGTETRSSSEQGYCDPPRKPSLSM